MNQLTLNIVTPERSILKDTAVESIVLPGGLGQFNVLPGHIDFITLLRYGAFGYRIGGEWNVAFLSGGFTQIASGKVTVLAETVDMAHELDVAKAEAEIQSATAKLKASKAGSPESEGLSMELEFAKARLKAAQKKMH